MSTDAKLTIGIWAVALIVWGAAILHGRMQHPEPEVDVEVEERYRPCTRDELETIAHNPAAPAVIRYMAANQLHNNGWCSCSQPYDQDADLTDTDLDWLESEGGA